MPDFWTGEQAHGQATVGTSAVVLRARNQKRRSGVVLRGTTQGLGLVWATAPASAVTLAVDIEWTEE